MPDVAAFDHIAIEVSDIEDSLEFYSDVLGLKVRDRERFETGETPFVSVVAGSQHIHLVPGDQDGGRLLEGNEHLCLLLRSDERDPVSTMTDVVAELEENGVEVASYEGESLDEAADDAESDAFVLGGKMLARDTYGAYGHGLSVYVRDPDGHTVELKVQ